MTGRRRAKAQETRLALAVGGTKVPYSGAGPVKGDVHTATVFYECKSSAQRASGDVKSFSLRKDHLTKMLDQQKKEGLPLHCMQVHYAGDRNDWAVMAWDQWLALLAVVEGGRNVGDSAEGRTAAAGGG